MKIRSRGYFDEMRGTIKTWDMVICRDGDKSYARAKVEPEQPRTSPKLTAESHHALASRFWKRLTIEERESWVRFAQTWAEPGKRPRRAVDICREAARMRYALGLEPIRRAPALPYPARVLDIRLEATADAHEFRMRVEHAVEVPAGYLLLVRITPQRNPGRTPIAAEARCICGPGPASATPLPESGGTVVFENARYGVQPGGKVGIAATVTRVADGLTSAEMFFVVKKPLVGADQ
jgi:hypothetical protein